MSLSPTEYLRHILDEINYLIEASSSLGKAEFLADDTLQRAFARSLEIIGEATKKIPEDVKTQHLQIEWRVMAGMRDKLIHDYLGVDYELVWDVIRNKIPDLKTEIESVLEQL